VTDWYRIGTGARGSVWSWMDAEAVGPAAAVGGGRVEIAVGGGDAWEVLAPVGGYTHTVHDSASANVLLPGSACLPGRNPDWRLLEFDLRPWAGRRIRLRFLFGSDAVLSTGSFRGWAIDDFALAPGAADPTDAPDPPARRRLLVQPPAPNPFNPRVTFRLEVPAQAGRIRLDLLDARGRLLRRVLDGVLQPGVHRLVWDGNDTSGLASASGVYYYRLKSRLGLESGRLVLVR
ncbi:MAG: FlgD immunoglobulin-like domain containing protein, partial [Candidatus Krumholzibacteriia bacterium]